MNYCERIKSIRTQLNESQSRFADKLELTQTTYSQYETGKRSLPDEVKQKLADMGIDLHWLITGKGDMYYKYRHPFPKDDEFEMGGDEKASTHGECDSYMTEHGSTTLQAGDGVTFVPFVSQKLSAGHGKQFEAESYTGEKVPIMDRLVRTYDRSKLVAAEVQGDSMKDVNICNGDVVVFCRGMVSGNGLYVLTIDDDVFVKRLDFNPMDEVVTVRSENKAYEPWRISEKDERITILGRVVAWIHRNQD